MSRRWSLTLLAGGLAFLGWIGTASPAHAQTFDATKWWHYPYYYFPANYWPTMSAPWPEPPGSPYRPPPAYMAYPPYREPHWRYEWWQPQTYYRGSHFWLDQF